MSLMLSPIMSLFIIMWFILRYCRSICQNIITLTTLLYYWYNTTTTEKYILFHGSRDIQLNDSDDTGEYFTYIKDLGRVYYSLFAPFCWTSQTKKSQSFVELQEHTRESILHTIIAPTKHRTPIQLAREWIRDSTYRIVQTECCSTKFHPHYFLLDKFLSGWAT